MNVVNNAPALLSRFEFLLKSYRAKCQEVVARKDEEVVTEHVDEFGYKSTSIHLPRFELESESRWLALAAVDAFFCRHRRSGDPLSPKSPRARGPPGDFETVPRPDRQRRLTQGHARSSLAFRGDGCSFSVRQMRFLRS